MENVVRSPKVRAIAYYRHSVQSLPDHSITLQRDQVFRWAGEHDVEVIHQFYDAGCSVGDSDERPAFKEMMAGLIINSVGTRQSDSYKSPQHSNLKEESNACPKSQSW